MGRLEHIETVLLDLDGTLYRGSRVVPGAPEAVRWLRDQLWYSERSPISSRARTALGVSPSPHTLSRG